MKNKVAFKIIKIVLIVLSALTLFGGLFVLSIFSSKEYIASLDSTYNTVKYMWVMWLFLPITIGCLVFGIVMTVRKSKAISNIIVGAIFSFFLFNYGCFTPIFTSQYSTDYSYWKELDATLHINLPEKMSVVIQDYTGGTQTTSDTFLLRYKSTARFESKDDCLAFKTLMNEKWIDSFANNSVPLSFSIEIGSGFDKYLLYCFDTEEYSPTQFESNNRYVCIAFSEAKTGMYLCEYQVK